jgi:hypothetical protein
MEEGVALQLICLIFNIRKKVCEVLDNFFPLKKIDEKEKHIIC